MRRNISSLPKFVHTYHPSKINRAIFSLSFNHLHTHINNPVRHTRQSYVQPQKISMCILNSKKIHLLSFQTPFTLSCTRNDPISMLLFNIRYQLTLKLQREISENSSTIFITDVCLTIFNQKNWTFSLLKCFIWYWLIVVIAEFLISRGPYQFLFKMFHYSQRLIFSSKFIQVCMYTASLNEIFMTMVVLFIRSSSCQRSYYLPLVQIACGRHQYKSVHTNRFLSTLSYLYII